ncbi:MAG: helicase C-terminal domain-containing protein [Microcoleaceae cyanobacterium]
MQQDSEFPAHIPTLIDSADDLEAWIHQKLTVCLQSRDWHDLIQTRPTQAETIRSAQARLTRQVFQHPPNPYNCHLLDGVEQEILQQLYEDCFNLNRNGHHLPESQSEAWEQFWQHWHRANQLRWVDIHRSQGSFSLYCSPLEMTETLQHIWARQPVVLVGGALDLEKSAPIYRHNIGLEDVTCVKFSPDRQNQLIQLYLPSGLPLPNTPRFHAALMEAIRTLLWTSTGASNSNQLTVLLIDDLPLKAQMGASLAAEFGSRVKVETLDLAADSILVTGWQFWQSMQGKLPCPHLLAIATLPLPSLENPLVAGQVSHYKQQRQDWFRLYLLPTALNQLQRAIAPVRETQGVVALFDGRVLHRSYGQQVLAALSPFARVHYLDTIWFDRI